MTRSALIILSLISLVGLQGCSSSPEKDAKKNSKPALSPSKQVQRKFFVCKDLIQDQWIGQGTDFSTDDQMIVVVARLDPTLLNTRLTFEILSPDNKIIEQEDREYKYVRDVGVFFEPTKLVEKGGGPGKYKANVLADSKYIGSVPFYLEDFREDSYRSTDNSKLKDVEWITPQE